MTSAHAQSRTSTNIHFPPGVNVSANQDEELNHETFQLQIDRDTNKCSLHTNTGSYWTLVAHGGIQAVATEM